LDHIKLSNKLPDHIGNYFIVLFHLLGTCEPLIEKQSQPYSTNIAHFGNHCDNIAVLSTKFSCEMWRKKNMIPKKHLILRCNEVLL